MRTVTCVSKAALLICFFVVGVFIPISFCQQVELPSPLPLKQFLKSSLLDQSGSKKHPFLDLNSAFAPDAFFCRKERDIEKQTGFPVRLRLGEWNWVEAYEGKRETQFSN